MAFGRGKSNRYHTLARCAFFNQHCVTKIIETYTVVMKNMINTIGKKIHTLVKENTSFCHKIRQECGFTQKVAFSTYQCVFFPFVRMLVGGLDSCFLTHTKKYMTPIHASIFEKHVKICVFIRDILKSQCKLIMLLGDYAQQKQVGWEVIFFRTQVCRVRGTYASAGA